MTNLTAKAEGTETKDILEYINLKFKENLISKLKVNNSYLEELTNDIQEHPAACVTIDGIQHPFVTYALGTKNIRYLDNIHEIILDELDIENNNIIIRKFPSITEEKETLIYHTRIACIKK